MSITEWEIRGPSYGNCNCDWGCPCQFNKLPTHGNCEALTAMHIDEGHYGDVPLAGLNWVCLWSWPGAVHEGHGTRQPIIDERADDAQRKALVDIIEGTASEEGSSFLWIFASTIEKPCDPIFAPIEFECDIEARQARVHVPGIAESTGTPMTDPFSGEPHDARLTLPNGMEFIECFCGSGTTKTEGSVKLDHADTWGQFTTYHVTQSGIVR